MAILKSEYKDEIDSMLFVEKLAVAKVHQHLTDLGEKDINYMALLRYKQSAEKGNVPRVVLETSQEEAKRTWDVLSKIIRGAEDFIAAGGVPNIQDALRAAKLQADLMARWGIDFNIQATDTAKRMLTHLVEDIILPIVTEDQKVLIAEAIAADYELSEWVMLESS